MISDVTPAASARTSIRFVIMCLGMFMAILDIQIVATSLPTIQKALGIATDQMVWVQTAYLTAEIVAIPLTGYLTGLLGVRWLFIGAVSVFTLASVGCRAKSRFPDLDRMAGRPGFCRRHFDSDGLLGSVSVVSGALFKAWRRR